MSLEKSIGGHYFGDHNGDQRIHLVMKDGRVSFEPGKVAGMGEVSVKFNTMIADAPQYKALQHQLSNGQNNLRQDGSAAVFEQHFKNALLCLEP